MWTLPGYGDHLELLNPGTRERMASLGAPEDVGEQVRPENRDLAAAEADTPVNAA